MKRLLGQALFVASVGAGALVFTPACVENDQSIFVRQVQAPPQNRQNGACIYQPDPTQVFLSHGALDIEARETYEAMLLVGNQMIPRGDALNTRAESNRAHINGAVVRVTATDGTTLGEFTAVASGFVDQAQGAQASWGLAAVTLIDAQTTNVLRARVTPGNPQTVIANVKVFGETLGGVDLESGEFQFPIEVCARCLVDFSTGDDPAVEGRDCNLPLDPTGAGANQLPCRAGQDERTPCQLCATPYCRGEVQ